MAPRHPDADPLALLAADVAELATILRASDVAPVRYTTALNGIAARAKALAKTADLQAQARRSLEEPDG